MGAGPCSGQQWSRGNYVTLIGKRTNIRFVGWGDGPQWRGSGQRVILSL